MWRSPPYPPSGELDFRRGVRQKSWTGSDSVSVKTLDLWLSHLYNSIMPKSGVRCKLFKFDRQIMPIRFSGERKSRPVRLRHETCLDMILFRRNVFLRSSRHSERFLEENRELFAGRIFPLNLAGQIAEFWCEISGFPKMLGVEVG